MMAAAPALADPAQDAAAEEIARLSYDIPNAYAPGVPATSDLAPAQQATVAGCVLTLTRWFPVLGPEAFITRTTVDLVRDQVVVETVEGEGDSEAWPPVAMVPDLLIATAAGPEGLAHADHSIDPLQPLFMSLDQISDPAAVAAALADFAAQPVRDSATPVAVLTYFDTTPDRITALSAALHTYIATWCRPAS